MRLPWSGRVEAWKEWGEPVIKKIKTYPGASIRIPSLCILGYYFFLFTALFMLPSLEKR